MPLKVLPSITNPPSGSRAPRWRFESQPSAPAVAPLHGQDHEVERVRGLDLEPRAAAAARLVGRVERLRHEALVAARECDREDRLGPGGVVHERRAARAAPRARARQARRRARSRDGRSDPRRRGAGSRTAAATAALAASRGAAARLTVTWNGNGRPSGPSAIASPSRISRARRQRAHHLDQLGHPGGHVVEAAREDARLVAVVVDLHADAVELPLGGGAAEPLDRRRPRPRRCREHRRERPADLDPQRLERRQALCSAAARDRRQVAGRAAARAGRPRPARRPPSRSPR